MDITVFIPTRGRTGLEHITANEMKKFSSRRAVIVCPGTEVFHYRTYAPHCDVIECPLQGIGPTRQFILEHSPTQGVVMLDDDMYFSYRPIPDQPRPLERVTTLEPLFDWISTQLDNGYMHGGISARQGNQHIAYGQTDCIRVNNCHFFDRTEYLRTGVRFDVLPVMEDFFVTLYLLLRGYPNRVAYHYCWSQRGSGAKGGCSLYRTAELQASAAEQLARFFPDYVKVVEKESDSQVGVMAKRKDVNIAWIKAWQDRLIQTNGYNAATPDLRRR